MPFLTVGAVTVKMATSASLDKQEVEVGEVVRAFDGTPRSSVRAYKADATGETAPLTTADRDALLTALKAGGSLSCSGDYLGTVSAVATGISVRPVAVGSVRRWAVSFTLMVT